MKSVAKRTGKTVGAGVSATAGGLGMGGNFNIMLVVDPQGNVAFTWSGGFSAILVAAYSLAPTVQVTNADDVEELRGGGMEIGGSVGPYGIEWLLAQANAYTGFTVSYAAPFPWSWSFGGGEFHVNINGTGVTVLERANASATTAPPSGQASSARSSTVATYDSSYYGWVANLNIGFSNDPFGYGTASAAGAACCYYW